MGEVGPPGLGSGEPRAGSGPVRGWFKPQAILLSRPGGEASGGCDIEELQIERNRNIFHDMSRPALPARPRLVLIALVASAWGVSVAISGAVPAAARETIAGPVEAEVVRVIDGDTFVATAHVWPGEVITVAVRVRGIDAPELHSHCAAERQAALEARDALQGMLTGGPVTISNIGGGKYYGRVLADVTDRDGHAIAPVMLERKLARAYGGGHRGAWCD